MRQKYQNFVKNLESSKYAILKRMNEIENFLLLDAKTALEKLNNKEVESKKL